MRAIALAIVIGANVIRQGIYHAPLTSADIGLRWVLIVAFLACVAMGW